MMLISGPVSGVMTRQLGPKVPIIAGGVVCCAAFALPASDHARMWQLLACGVGSGIGIGLAYAALPNAITAHVRPEQVGIATGVNTLARSIGSSVGAAVIAAILRTRVREGFRGTPGSRPGSRCAQRCSGWPALPHYTSSTASSPAASPPPDSQQPPDQPDEPLIARYPAGKLKANVKVLMT